MQIITDYSTGAPRFKVIGGGDSGDAVAVSLTTAERTAITPDAGVLIWDTDLEKLFIGDGSTAGGVEVQGGGGEGTVTGIEASVDGGTATITATGSTTSVKITGTGGMDVKGNTNGEIELGTPGVYRGRKELYDNLKNARFFANVGTPLTILHMSDVHGDTDALTRIIADKTYLGNNVEEMICTGDMSFGVGGEIASWWNKNILTCIGNHDSVTESGGVYDWTGVSMADRDAYYIAPFESNWSITHTSGTSYYYKDYTMQGVRLIVMDGMLYVGSSTTTEAATQTAWLETLLADAITNSLHVVIAIHAPHGGAKLKECSFSPFVDGSWTMPTNSDANTPAVVINAVASAISNGLYFVGYLSGHIHTDFVMDVTGDGTQLMYCVACAATNYPSQWQNSDMYRGDQLDAYNLVTIDTNKKYIKIIRGGGADVDNKTRPRIEMTVEYSSGTIISEGRANTAKLAEVAVTANTASSLDASAVGYGLEVNGGTISDARHIPLVTVNGGTVTLDADKAYLVYANESAVTLNAEANPGGKVGRDTTLQLVVTSTDNVTLGNGVVFASTLQPTSMNYCTAHYFSDKTVITIDYSVVSQWYTVTSASGTADGSLYFGLMDSSLADTVFIQEDSSIFGSTVALGGATVSTQKKFIGSGSTNSILSGLLNVTADGDFYASNCSVTGGTFNNASGSCTLEDVSLVGDSCIVSAGSTVTLLGTITYEQGQYFELKANAAVNGSALVDLNHQQRFAGDTTFYVSGLKITNGNGNSANWNGGGVIVWGSGKFNMDGCEIYGCTAANGGSGGFAHISGANTGGTATNCYIHDNITAESGTVYATTSSQIRFENCIISGNTSGGYGGAFSLGGVTGTVIKGCTVSDNTCPHPEMNGMYILGTSATITIENCVFCINQNIALGGTTPTLTIKGSLVLLAKIASVSSAVGKVVIVSGATVDVTGNTYTNVIQPGGNIEVQGNITFIRADGTSVTISSGTYSTIKSDGTTA